MHVAPPEMLLEVLLARKPVSGTAVAVGIRTHQGFLCVDVFLVDFALVSKQATGVCETLHFVASWFHAFIGSIVFIHVFAIQDASR